LAFAGRSTVFSLPFVKLGLSLIPPIDPVLGG
jgi:hypothetical protein